MEAGRLDMQYHVLTLLLNGRLYVSPFRKDGPSGKILDVCCGTGIWAIDVADENPEYIVKGIDLAPIQPTWVPPNVRFELDDL
jgi:2-polyprenyl-3-methyl-5-hydroxy-6-metoxy-1,4-benzoquinol methylase